MKAISRSANSDGSKVSIIAIDDDGSQEDVRKSVAAGKYTHVTRHQTMFAVWYTAHGSAKSAGKVGTVWYPVTTDGDYAFSLDEIEGKRREGYEYAIRPMKMTVPCRNGHMTKRVSVVYERLIDNPAAIEIQHS